MASASTMVSGLSALPGVAAPRASTCTFRPKEAVPFPCASNRTVTWLGARTWPGATRANSSSRLCGFCTMPTTRRAVPSWCQRSPILRLKAEATPSVTATWPGPAG